MQTRDGVIGFLSERHARCPRLRREAAMNSEAKLLLWLALVLWIAYAAMPPGSIDKLREKLRNMRKELRRLFQPNQ